MTHSSSSLCFPCIFCKVELKEIMLWDSGSGITEQNQSLNQKVFIKPSSNSLGRNSSHSAALDVSCREFVKAEEHSVWQLKGMKSE